MNVIFDITFWVFKKNTLYQVVRLSEKLSPTYFLNNLSIAVFFEINFFEIEIFF